MNLIQWQAQIPKRAYTFTSSFHVGGARLTLVEGDLVVIVDIATSDILCSVDPEVLIHERIQQGMDTLQRRVDAIKDKDA